MKINCYTTFADGYERHMRMFLKYYLDFCDNIYIIYDTRSENKCQFLNSYNTNKIVYKSWDLRNGGDSFSESERTIARNYFYTTQNKNADWNIVVDCDEFVYSKKYNQSIVDFLSQKNTGDYFVCRGYNVATDNENNAEFFDSIPNLLTLKYLPASAYNKPIVSKCGVTLDFSEGCHRLIKTNGAVACTTSPILIHTKYLNYTYVIKDIDEILSTWGKPKTNGVTEHIRNIYNSEAKPTVSNILMNGKISESVFE